MRRLRRQQQRQQLQDLPERRRRISYTTLSSRPATQPPTTIVKAVWLLYCVLFYVTAISSADGFSPHFSRYHDDGYNRRKQAVIERSAKAVADSNDDSCTHHHRSSSHNWNRRDALIATLASTSTALLPAAVAQASSTVSRSSSIVTDDDPLEGILLGQGRWEPLTTTPTKRSTTTVVSSTTNYYTASFCTYATRFLICYDDGVRRWWQQQLLSSQQLDNGMAQIRLGRAYGAFSKSLEQAFAPVSSSTELYDRFMISYGNQPGATHQIALLFTLLPPIHQPISRLQNYCETNKPIAVSDVSTNIRRYSPLMSETTPSTIQDDNWTRLLSASYHPTPTKPGGTYFTIVPALSLSEVAADSNFGLSGIVTSTMFGPFSSEPLIRELPIYRPSTYALFGIAGASGCSLTHAIVIPLDVLKTRAQTDPSVMNTDAPSGPGSLLDAGAKIVRNEGVQALLLGAQATIVGYFWYGLSVYPSYTFFKRYLSLEWYPLDYAVAHGNEIALLAGACAAVVASLGLSPIEAARIRVVANPTVYKPLGLVGTLQVIATEDEALGWRNLYAGLPSLLIRQVVFGSIKFLAFERACEFIFGVWPGLGEATWTALMVSLVAGGWSGVVSSVVSQPADSVLTYVSKAEGGGNLNLLNGVRRMVSDDGPAALFRGLGSRCVWAGSIIAGQFLLYDIFRTFFGVTTNDLSQIYELYLPR